MQYGDIVQLGRHRLMCGDATSYDDIEALLDGRKVDLVLTDPPYGVKCHSGYYRFKKAWGNMKPRCESYNPNTYNAKMIGDTSTDTARAYWDVSQCLTDKHIIWGGQYFTDFLPPKKGWLVWGKRQSLYNHSQCELAWTSLHTNIKYYEQLWSGACRAGSHILNPRPALCLTQKPVELHARILEDFTQEGNLILDCFGGSGTTLIACEISNRTCCMMELSPDYCNVIVNRYISLTQGSLMLQ